MFESEYDTGYVFYKRQVEQFGVDLEFGWISFGVDLEFGWLQTRFRPPSIERNSLF